MIESADYQNLLNFNAICDCFIVTGLFNCFSDNNSLQTDIVVITIPQFHTTKPKFNFFPGFSLLGTCRRFTMVEIFDNGAS